MGEIRGIDGGGYRGLRLLKNGKHWSEIESRKKKGRDMGVQGVQGAKYEMGIKSRNEMRKEMRFRYVDTN